MLEQNIKLEKVSKLLAEDDDDRLKLVIRDQLRKGLCADTPKHTKWTSVTIPVRY